MEPNFQATRQLQKRIGELFTNTLNKPKPPSDAQYQNLADLNNYTNTSNDNAQILLPPGTDLKDVEIKNVSVETEYSNNGEPFITYEVTWLEKTPQPPPRKSILDIENMIKVPAYRRCDGPCGRIIDGYIGRCDDCRTKTPESKPKKSVSQKMMYLRNSSNSSLSDESEIDEPVPLVKKTSSMMKIPGHGRCDGPCGRIIDLSAAVQYGCDHSICDDCRTRNPSAALYDGTAGCCNTECVKEAMASGNKLCAGLSSLKSSVVGQIGALEAVPTRICILTNYHKEVLRSQLENEYPTSARLSVIIKSLAYYKDLIADSRYYYSTTKPTRLSDLTPINLVGNTQRFYSIIDRNKLPKLYVLVVGKEIHLFDSCDSRGSCVSCASSCNSAQTIR